MLMIYFYGTGNGEFIKIGESSSLTDRREKLKREAPMSGDPDLRLLAAVRGKHSDEVALVGHHGQGGIFDHLRERGEWFRADSELVEYVNWLREQWWTWHDEQDGPDEHPEWQQWCPAPGRRCPRQTPDPGLLIQSYEATGSLAGSAWASLSSAPPLYNDIYTPPMIIDKAREAMGGIDLDAASHWVANRVHRIPLIYHKGRSAFDNPWSGRVWLNPPYGENADWFAEILKYWDRGDITQLCMLSPVWAFSTRIASSVVERSSAMLLLSPTPSFWGYSTKRNRISGPEECGLGSNHPHAILYMGDRAHIFRKVYADLGIPCRLES